MSDGWKKSTEAWIASMGEAGDFGRRFVLDAPMLARVRGRAFGKALDVGCGEGRFCRQLRGEGIETIGIDPTEALLEAARRRDPRGDYRLGRAENIDFAEGSFDLVVSYLALIDIDDIDAAIAEMVRVLRSGGTLLIANLTSFMTAGMPTVWSDEGGDGERRFVIDNYLTERAEWASWSGIRVRNWHRPLARYMSAFLAAGLELRYFAEPTPNGGDPADVARYRRVPWFLIMEWRKPGAA